MAHVQISKNILFINDTRPDIKNYFIYKRHTSRYKKKNIY